jgi:hypothetical protein
MTDAYYEDINHNYSGASISVRALTEAIGRPGAHSGLRNGLSAQKYSHYPFIEGMST